LTAVWLVPPPAGIAPNSPPAIFGRAQSQQFLIRRGARLTRFGERTARRDGLGETHQRDARSRGPHLRDEVELRPHQRGKSARDAAHHSNAQLLQAQQARRGDAHRDREQGCRCARQEALQTEDQCEHYQRQHQSGDGRLRHVLEDGKEVAKEPGLLDMDAEQLRDLIDHDHQPDPRLETSQHRLGDEVGDKAQPQHGRERQDDPDQHRQGGARDDQLRGRAVRHRAPQLGRGQDGDRRRGTHAERARGAEQRVDHHRHERRVQADLHRQAGDGGVRHRLRDDHRRRGQPSGHVAAEPVLGVTAQPDQAGNEAGFVARHGFSVQQNAQCGPARPTTTSTRSAEPT
jgi:hypothetical protein